MNQITFSQIDQMILTADDLRKASEAAFMPLDSLSREDFVLVLHCYDLADLVSSQAECQRLLMKNGVFPG
jgi:hypothetical protein